MRQTDLHSGMAVNTAAEAEFFLKHIKSEHTVLEWGSGSSTVEIAKRAKFICSIEHNREWFDHMVDLNPDNAHISYVPQNSEPGPGEDGNEIEFKDYVKKGIELSMRYGPFDIIFIDGRARVACASICNQLAHAGTIIFVHDYDHPDTRYKRTEYYPIEQLYFDRVEHEFTMHKFKLKSK